MESLTYMDSFFANMQEGGCVRISFQLIVDIDEEKCQFACKNEFSRQNKLYHVNLEVKPVQMTYRMCLYDFFYFLTFFAILRAKTNFPGKKKYTTLI